MMQMNVFTKQIVTDTENKLMVIEGGGGINWEIGIDIYYRYYYI